jgi:hypothetical protein
LFTSEDTIWVVVGNNELTSLPDSKTVILKLVCSGSSLDVSINASLSYSQSFAIQIDSSARADTRVFVGGAYVGASTNPGLSIIRFEKDAANLDSAMISTMYNIG